MGLPMLLGLLAGSASEQTISVDPAGKSTLLHGPGYWTSYDSGKSWVSELPQGHKDWLPLASSWTGESSGFSAPGTNAVHNLGAIEACPPNGCWTNNHTKSSCNNVSLWSLERDVAWTGGCHTKPPPALSEKGAGELVATAVVAPPQTAKAVSAAPQDHRPGPAAAP